MNTPSPQENAILPELSPSFAAVLQQDRHEQLQERAVKIIVEVANTYITDEAEAMRPAQAERWQAWSDEVVQPLITAAPEALLSDSGTTQSYTPTIQFKVPVQNQDVITQAGIRLELIAAPDSKSLAFCGAVREHGIAARFKDSHPDEAFVIPVDRDGRDAAELAQRINAAMFYTSAGQGRFWRFWRRRAEAAVDPLALVDTTMQRQQAALAALTIRGVRYSLANRNFNSRHSETGSVLNPEPQIITPYGTIPYLYAQNIVKLLSKESAKLEAVALRQDTSTGFITDAMKSAHARAAQDAERQARVADLLLELITGSESFKKLIS
ncbi:MAG: hypothetical protein JWM81_95 [Candidatus Saccharibacteria bacterium]|nr:hypothetical protein [Candidatus Saccharibacteria bacterium]